MTKNLYILLLISLVFSCKEEKNNAEISKKIISSNYSVKYAKGFEIQHYNDYNKLSILSPFPNSKKALEVYLVPDSIEIPNHLKNKKIIKTPIQKFVVTSTTHIPMVEALDSEELIVGFPQTEYISSEKTYDLVKQGKIKNLGTEQDMNTEVLLELSPDVVVGFSLSSTNNMFQNIENAGIPVVFNGEWLEETPLGRAEWIKFFGILLNKESQADSIFNHIKNEYLSTKELAKKSKSKPTLLSGVLFEDKWHLPAGQSFTATLFKDANMDYVWQNSEGKGSLVLGLESVIEKASYADIWIGAGIYTTLTEMKLANNHYEQFNAFKQNKVYTFSKKRGINGGIIYFELAPMVPHLVLKDLIKAGHPELLPDYVPVFLEKLNQ